MASSALMAFAAENGLPTSYPELHAWSVDHSEELWRLLHRHFDLPGGRDVVREPADTPGRGWFPDSELNFAEHLLSRHGDRAPAIQAVSEARWGLEAWDHGRLRAEVARVRTGLQELGVERGDRVAAYLPNLPETVAAFLATASVGAIWTSAAPEFGVRGVVDRFAQVKPKVLLAVDGYIYNGKVIDRSDEAAAIHAEVGGALVRFGLLDDSRWPQEFGASPAPLDFERVPFDHPLWILYSSGTTGLPKAIVHGHGGMLLEHLKHGTFHLDARPGDRFLWFTTTGWMMWNLLVAVLLTDASIVLFDGAPVGGALWDAAEVTGTTVLGVSAGFIAAEAKAGARPRDGRELSVRAVGSTGSPLAAEHYGWVLRELGERTWLFSISGGTDVCTAFLTGVPTLPVHAGELQAAALGADVQSWDPEGQHAVGRVGELVLAQPMPCMPVAFWGDDGSKLHDAYYATYPGTWRHGDWVTITEHGSAVIHGRSDATINRGGVRMGTAEIYAAVLGLDEVTDALVVDVPDGRGGSRMPLFVVLREDAVLDTTLTRAIAQRIRTDCSPRHVPDEVHAIAKVPRTLSGKVLEVPVKRILAGEAPEDVVQADALEDPAALEPFVALAGREG